MLRYKTETRPGLVALFQLQMDYKFSAILELTELCEELKKYGPIYG